MRHYPKYTDENKKGTAAVIKLLKYFDPNYWVPRELTNIDVGVDVVFELSQDSEFRGSMISGQVKGRTNLKRLQDGTLSLSIESKTVNYGLCLPGAFVIFLVDLTADDAYYLEIHEYLEVHPELEGKLGQKYATLHFDKAVSGNDADLQRIATKRDYHYDSFRGSRDDELFHEFVNDFEDTIRYIVNTDPAAAMPIDIEVFNRIEALADKWIDTAHMFKNQECQNLLESTLTELGEYQSLFNDRFFRTKDFPEKIYIHLCLNGPEAHDYLTKVLRPGMHKVRNNLAENYGTLRKMYRERLVNS